MRLLAYGLGHFEFKTLFLPRNRYKQRWESGHSRSARKAVRASQGMHITILDRRCPYFSDCFLLIWQVLRDFVMDRMVIRIDIPLSVRVIHDDAFEECSDLTTVQFCNEIEVDEKGKVSMKREKFG